MVVELLYAFTMGNERIFDFADELLGAKKIRNAQADFAKGLFKGVVAHLQHIDSVIKAHLKSWELSRLGVIDKCILRLGVYEILKGEIDAPVAINEAIEIAKILGAENTGKFVNGVLDAINKQKLANSSCDSGNLSLELHSADLADFGEQQTQSLVLSPKSTKNHESQTENPSVVLNAKSAESSLRGELQIRRSNPKNSATKSRPIRSAKKQGKSKKPKSTKFAKSNEKSRNGESLDSTNRPRNDEIGVDCHDSPKANLAMTEKSVDCFGDSNESPRNDESTHESAFAESVNPPQQTIEGIAVEVAEFLPNFECGTRVCEHSKFGKSMQDLPKTKLPTQFIFAPPTLSSKQQSALNFILSHDKTLLFGDTGSGKTEIYINAICATIAQGKNTLFLMPEIALTPQMERRLKGVFGDLVCIWHSKVSKAKKERILANLHSIKIIAGARSALFLPLENLGLIIIDEEHDEAYKSSNNPRYNSRDLAIFLAQKQGIRLILGSATPSLNSYYNFAKENRIFRLKGGYFEGKKNIIFDNDLDNVPQSLLDKIATTLKNHKQIIVFVPMRGNFKVLQCESCGSGVKCKHCSINMSLHSKKNALICHYCGYAEPFFYGKTKCKFCASTAFKALKIGTQEVYKNLSAHFEGAKIAIFDRDEVKSDLQLRGILSDFNDGKIDILIGTQMISKGHDYHNVELVAILGIDSLLNSSDFRAYERAVGLLFQIAGRCGRKNDGEVFINTQNSAFFMRFLNDYEDFLRFELENRANLYPPFMRLALICAQNKNEGKAKEILQNAKKIVESTRRNIEIVGLNKAPIERIGGLWRYFMLIRAKSAKELLTALLPIKDMGLIIDIDPQSIF